MSANTNDVTFKDLISKLYRSRSSCPKFINHWKNLWKDIKERENIKESHLIQLAELCDLCVERDEIIEEIKGDGRMVAGPSGLRAHPLITVKNQTITTILKYHKLLGLALCKDSSVKVNEEEASEWSL